MRTLPSGNQILQLNTSDELIFRELNLHSRGNCQLTMCENTGGETHETCFWSFMTSESVKRKPLSSMVPPKKRKKKKQSSTFPKQAQVHSKKVVQRYSVVQDSIFRIPKIHSPQPFEPSTSDIPGDVFRPRKLGITLGSLGPEKSA